MTLEHEKEVINPKHLENISSNNDESHQSHLTCESSPALEKKKSNLDARPMLASKLLTEVTDSQQSLSTNSPDYFDEETAV